MLLSVDDRGIDALRDACRTRRGDDALRVPQFGIGFGGGEHVDEDAGTAGCGRGNGGNVAEVAFEQFRPCCSELLRSCRGELRTRACTFWLAARRARAMAPLWEPVAPVYEEYLEL